MDTTQYAPRLLTPDQIDIHQRRHILLSLGQRLDEILISLEHGPRFLGHTLSVPVVVAMFRPWAHPLLTDQNVLDLAIGLAASVKAHSDYELFGTWDAEHEDALGARSHQERLDFLATDVERAVHRMLFALEAVK